MNETPKFRKSQLHGESYQNSLGIIKLGQLKSSKNGRGGQTRTDNPSLPKRVRYQLRHTPSINSDFIQTSDSDKYNLAFL